MKKRIWIVILLAAACTSAWSQKIIVSGEETTRSLVWADFTGKPDKSSPFAAYTWWTLRYRHGGTQSKGDSVMLNRFEITLQLDPDRSWVKSGKETADLLTHEQGHFNIGILCMKEIYAAASSRSFGPTNYNAALQTLFNDTLKKYSAMGEQYDSETEHGNNKPEQQRWNAFFKEKL